MPSKPKRPCSKMGCRELTTERFCSRHAKVEAKEYDRARGSSSQRGYTSRWQRYSRSFRKANPLCVNCSAQGLIRPSEHVDHIKAVSGADDPLFWDKSNHQALCQSCHSRKTIREDGGFGSGRRGRGG